MNPTIEFQALSDAVDRELDDDRQWFDARPRREIRMRQTFPNEQRIDELMSGVSCPPHLRCFTIVRQIEPGFRVRCFFFQQRDYMPPVTEAGCWRAFHRLLARSGITVNGVAIDEFAHKLNAGLNPFN